MRSVTFILCLALLGLSACGDEKKPEPSPPATGGSGAPPAKGGAALGAGGQAGTAGLTAETRQRVAEALKKGRAFLLTQQVESGAFGDDKLGDHGKPAVAFTCMAVGGVIGATDKIETKSDEKIRKALAFLASQQKDSGAIFDDPRLTNYLTSGSVGAFAMARISDFRDAQRKAREYLVKSQITGDEKDASYGAFPYKQDQGQTADLSNTQMAAQAVHDDGGVAKDEAFWKNMRVYLDRAQNNSETNSFQVVMDEEGQKITIVAGDDGGAGYGPGMSKAGRVKRSDGRWEVRRRPRPPRAGRCRRRPAGDR